jgi:hypothetical protein
VFSTLLIEWIQLENVFFLYGLREERGEGQEKKERKAVYNRNSKTI